MGQFVSVIAHEAKSLAEAFPVVGHCLSLLYWCSGKKDWKVIFDKATDTLISIPD